MESNRSVVAMAGYWMAHALWSVVNGEVLVPILGYLKHDGSQSMQRLAMGSIKATAMGEQRLAALQADECGAVFIKDCLVSLDSGKTDCLLLDIRFAADHARQLQYLLPYRNARHAQGFAVHRLQVSGWDGFSTDEIDGLTQALFDGLGRHEQGSALWREHYIEQAGESSAHAGEESTRFSQEEFELLRRVPFLVFFLVAAADGKVDKKEVLAFGKQLLEVDRHANPLLTRVVTNVINDVPQMIGAMLEQLPEFTAELRQVRQLLEARLGIAESQRFAQAVLAMARDIAAASGGLFGLGSRISKSEQMALILIATSLGVQ